MVSLQSFKFFLRKVLLPAIVKWNGPEDLSNGLTLVPLNGLQQPFPAQRYHKAYAGPYGCQYHRFPYIFQTNLHQQHQQRAAKGSCFQWILCLVLLLLFLRHRIFVHRRLAHRRSYRARHSQVPCHLYYYCW